MPRVRAALLGIMCLLLVTDAAAQGLIRVQGPPLRQACFADFMRFCRGILPGGGRIIACLNMHANDLSQPCFQALALRGLASAGALRTCRADYERLCPQARPTIGAGLACLLDNVQKLSPVCRDALSRQDLLDDEPMPAPPPRN